MRSHIFFQRRLIIYLNELNGFMVHSTVPYHHLHSSILCRRIRVLFVSECVCVCE